MSSAGIVLSIAAALAMGSMSPGPSFVLVSRMAISRSRGDGLAAALAMGLGGVLFALLALAGLTALLSQFHWLYLLLKIAGGAYLVHIGVKIWRSAKEPMVFDSEEGEGGSTGRAFRIALLTCVSPRSAKPYTGANEKTTTAGTHWKCLPLLIHCQAADREDSTLPLVFERARWKVRPWRRKWFPMCRSPRT